MKERAEKMQIDLGGNLLPGFVGGSKDIESCAERLRILYSAGIAAAVLFGLLNALLFKPRAKK